MMYLCVIFFFYAWGLLSFLICGFIVFIKFGKTLAVIFLNIFFFPLYLLFCGDFCYMYIKPYEIVSWPTDALFIFVDFFPSVFHLDSLYCYVFKFTSCYYIFLLLLVSVAMSSSSPIYNQSIINPIQCICYLIHCSFYL